MEQPDIIYPDDKDSTENLNFRYNRTERLKSAPKEVQDYYNGNWKGPPKGFFKALVHTTGSKFIFAALCFVLAISVVVMIVNSRENIITFANVKSEISAFSFDDIVYVTLQCQEKNTKANEKTDSMIQKEQTDTIDTIDTIKNNKIKVVLKALDAQKNIINFSEQEDFFTKNEIFFRTTFQDYDIISVLAEITIKGQTETIFCNVEKK